MDKSFPVSHSVISADALRKQIQIDYMLESIVGCRYWQIGLNDTYMVFCQDKQYVLRLYRVGRRTDAQIEYELDALQYLDDSGVPVSIAVTRTDGKRQAALALPEGRRQYVLFTNAPGKTYKYSDDIQIAREYGKAVARIHNATDSFDSQHTRFELDLEFLLHKPLRQIEPFLKHRDDNWSYLQRLGDRIEREIKRLSRDGMDWGFCHGDTNGYNAHLANGTDLTFFDFDFCGKGWRVYELASFQWLALMNPSEDRWSNFLAGYGETRQLNKPDLEAVPYFVGARQIWIDAMQLENGCDWGYNGIDDSYFDRKITYLRNLESAHFSS